MTDQSTDQATRAESQRGRDFSRRVLGLRSLGCALSAIAVFTVFQSTGASHLAYGVWALNAFLWPAFAHALAMSAVDPVVAERRNLLCDSAFGGGWVVAMHFSGVPSAVLISVLLMHNASAGGYRLLRDGILSMMAGGVLAGIFLGFVFRTEIEFPELLASLPLLLIYPTLVGLASFRLAKRLSKSERALRRISDQDDLTSLLNRRSWMRALTNCYADKRTGRSGTASIALIDIDGFKEINDLHGHLQGDSLIRILSDVLSRELGRHDVIGRYGGDEFCVLFDGQAAEKARKKLERVCAVFAGATRGLDTSGSVTLSVGVANFDGDLVSPTAWLALADGALYSAKRSGKDCVVIARADSGLAGAVLR
ncbi:sensor domain-containing diguanylate cyclase [Pandoraea sp. SD6-2]|uniref:sensor domain-containing diguanylate cyclase n=1 Tax=Pandoraea sp. SD6-2 TaxID=1286093 RepID=UPI00032D7601|nr:sensor domain-containing diguanylate cyclase [Pandoraea sp. SD6-2]EON13273.1 diguanylate cyclase (GGDEF) domain-containing protein, AdrA family [Pandoraea sp. SD6-2]